MRTVAPWVILGASALVAASAVALRPGGLPLGVRGEWEWLRVTAVPAWPDVALAASGVAGFAGFAALGLRALGGEVTRARETLWLSGLVAMAAAVQALAMSGAPEAYGLAKWAFALSTPGASGYHTVASRQMRDPARFLADYPDWIKRQDALHIGTHPPGLFLTAHATTRTMAEHPRLARRIVDHLPESVAAGFDALGDYKRFPRADRAALALTGALTLLACASTVVPLYLLARASLPPPIAWASAALWPLVPSAILFQPAADTAFPLLSTTALALAAHATGRRPRSGLILAGGAGIVLAAGMLFSLVFLPVGLVVAIVLACAPGTSLRWRGAWVVATGAGFLAPTLAFWAATHANPFVIWWWNQANHARFYAEYPRTYRAWVLVNPIEMAVALGIPASAWIAAGLQSWRTLPRAAWATAAVLVVLNFSGRNLSEVARLWLPLMPPLLLFAAVGLTRLGGGPKALAATVALTGAQVLILESAIQVVYPV